MTDLFDPAAWQTQARCKGASADLFFPERGASTREAKAVCRTCPVRRPCLDYALSTNQRWGVWGGMSERERRAMRRENRLRNCLTNGQLYCMTECAQEAVRAI